MTSATMQFALSACTAAVHAALCLCMPCMPIISSCPAVTCTGLANDPSTWSLIDGSAPPGQFGGVLRMIVMTSPNESNYSEFVKGGRQVLLCAALRPKCNCVLASSCCLVCGNRHQSFSCSCKQAGSDRGSMAQAVGDRE